MDKDGSTRTRGKVGRPRSEKSHQAILHATIDLLAEQGFDGLSIEGVAERAGVGKTTIYRHWDNKEALVNAALVKLRSTIEMPRPGDDLYETIIQFLSEIVAVFREHPLAGAILLRLIGEADEHPEMVRGFFQQINQRAGLATEYIINEQLKGEIDPDLDWTMTGSMVAGPLLYQIILNRLMGKPEITPAMIEKYAEIMLRALRKPPGS